MTKRKRATRTPRKAKKRSATRKRSSTRKRSTTRKRTARRKTRAPRRRTRAARRVTSAPAVEAAAAAARTDAGLVAVTMTIDFGSNPPGDILSVRRIDSTALPSGKASVTPGRHTTGWDVVSPTVRPIGFAVSIVEDLTGRLLLSRPNERTGTDGKGAGADQFRV